MSRHQFTAEERARGGRKAARLPGGPCPRCGRDFPSHAAHAGHLGLHAFADRYTQGDLKAAGIKLGIIGAAASDPAPWNGAYAEGHRFLAERRKNE